MLFVKSDYNVTNETQTSCKNFQEDSYILILYATYSLQ